MNLFGIGPLELALILLLALIIFGPGRLPEIGAALGRSLRDFRKMTREVSASLEEVQAAMEKQIELPEEAETAPSKEASLLAELPPPPSSEQLSAQPDLEPPEAENVSPPKAAETQYLATAQGEGVELLSGGLASELGSTEPQPDSIPPDNETIEAATLL